MRSNCDSGEGEFGLLMNRKGSIQLVLAAVKLLKTAEFLLETQNEKLASMFRR